MRKLATIAIALAWALAARMPASAHGALAETLQGRYKTLGAAMANDDRKGVAAVLAPHFVKVDVVGTPEGARAMMSDDQWLFIDPRAVYTTTLSFVRQLGDTVTVQRRLAVRTTKPGADGDGETAEFVALSTDTWIDVKGTWLLQKSSTEQLAYYVNGRQVARDVRTQSIEF